MENNQYQAVPLRYSTQGTLDGVPDDHYFCVGMNDQYGLVDIVTDKGNPVFEGRINIESILKGTPATKATSDMKDDAEAAIVTAYEEFLHYGNSDLEVLSNTLHK